jgi:hypothetical protein
MRWFMGLLRSQKKRKQFRPNWRLPGSVGSSVSLEGLVKARSLSYDRWSIVLLHESLMFFLFSILLLLHGLSMVNIFSRTSEKGRVTEKATN